MGLFSSHGNNLARGIAYHLLAMFLFAVMDVCIKLSAIRYPVNQQMFFRQALAFLPIFGYMFLHSSLADIRTSRLSGHLWRGIIGMFTMVLLFLSFKLLPLADVYAIAFSVPVFVTIFSALLLKEPVGPHRWSAVMLGFAGVLIILRPGSTLFAAAALVPLAASVLNAYITILVRQLTETETTLAIVFYFALFGTLATAATLPLGLLLPALPATWITPATAEEWLILIAIGITGGTAQILIVLSFTHAPVSLLSPFKYSIMLWGLLFGYTIFGDLPDQFVLLGGAVVIASGIYIAAREARHARREAARRGEEQGEIRSITS